MSTQLILNADDFGLTRGVNEGILRAHREGILTSTTLMANGEAFDHAVELARTAPALGVGCHLVLIGGKPVAAPREVASLVDGEGNLPRSLQSLVRRVTSGSIRPADIEVELRAQIEKIRAAGITPTHLDTHKHSHAHPRVFAALARVAKELGIHRVRRPIESLRRSWSLGGRAGPAQLIAASAVRAVAPRFNSIAKKYGLRSPDHFLGLALTGHLGAEPLRQLIEGLPAGCCEIMLHPGICDSDLERTGTRLLRQREAEMNALMDAGVKHVVAARGIDLVNFAALG
jgi:chitin disaccharide deacetylase